jgi:uncharacterized membrane protein YheB (UPF0754 family)
MKVALFIIPLMTAIAGWLANMLFIKMIFRPFRPVKIGGLAFQGFFPKKQEQLAKGLGILASTEFHSFIDLEKRVSDPANLQKVLPTIESHVDEFLRVKLGKEIPMISMFIGDRTIESLKKVFMQEIEILFPVIMRQFANNLENELDIEAMVRMKIMAISSEKLEKEFHHRWSKELSRAGIVGAGVGFIIGLLEISIILLVSR